MRAMPRSRWRVVWVAYSAALVMSCALAQERPPPDAVSVERRLGSVQTLIEKSSAARQIDASGIAGAQERRARARNLHTQAAEALRAGDAPRANALLDDASKLMIEAVRMAAPEQIVQDKARKDFDARLESTRTLTDALKRISAEKAAGRETTELIANVERGMREARSIAAGGDVERARMVLDQSYLVAKAAIGSLRGGDTLVRSLSFASKDEEYHYEIDRNDTHRMLVKLLVEEKRAASQAMVTPLVERAQTLRAQATERAGRGDFVEAIRLLEDSTRELVRAIRSAGIYIPG